MGWEKEKRGRGAGLEEASKQRREKTDGQEAKKIPSSLRTDGKREKGGGGGWENYRRAKRENEERKTEGTGLQSITGARKEFFFSRPHLPCGQRTVCTTFVARYTVHAGKKVFRIDSLSDTTEPPQQKPISPVPSGKESVIK